jgi:hypothetical protein
MRILVRVFVLILLGLGSASAQETRGNISGTVEDPQGVVPGATVRITNVDTRVSQTVVSNGRGYFEAPLLQPGNYQVVVEMPGFKTLSRTGIVLAVGQQISLSLKLDIGQLSEQVSVTAEAPLLDTVAVSSGQNFDSRMVEGLPMFSNMPIMLTRFSSGVNPSTNQSLVSQGFVDGTTSAAGTAVGGVGSNNYSIDGASNNGSGRRIASSPNADTIQEMRVESSNFDSSVGHGTGLQISMMTRAGTNAYRGTTNYQYWTNRLNALNPSQRLTLKPGTVGRELYGSGRSHNLALTAGGPIVNDKLFFFANYSYVNDYIPGKNQGSSTVPANEKHLSGDFSDLLTLPNPAQYQIYDPLTVRPDPNNPNRFIRSPFPNNIIPANRIVNPLYNLYRQMLPTPNQNFVENGTTPSANYYRGGEPDSPVSSLFGGRVDYIPTASDRLFFRGSGSTFLEGVNDWTYENPTFNGLHSFDRSRYTWAGIGNWTRVFGVTVVDTQVASNEFFQDDLYSRLHEYKPSDMGLPSYLDALCQSQDNDCMLPVIGIAGYQGISFGSSSGDRTRNFQIKSDLTSVRGAHTLRTGVDVRTAERERGPGGNPSGNLQFTNEFTRQASDTAQLTPSNLGLSMAAFMLGIPSTTSATIQATTVTRNHYLGAYGQDTWRVNRNLTLNVGLRVEWENGIREVDGRMLVDFDPDARLAISDAAEAAYARTPLAQLPASQFRVNGGSIYATAPGQDGSTWKPETLWMPRISFAQKLGEKTVFKGGYGVYYDTLNANDYTANVLGYSSATTNTNSTDFGRTFRLGNPYAGVLGIADPFPVRADGSRFDEPVGASLGLDSVSGSAYTTQNTRRIHGRQQRWRLGIQRELLSNLAVEVAYEGSYSNRIDISVRQDYLPEQYWIPGSLNARDATTQAFLVGNTSNPFAIANFASLQASNPVLYQRMASNAFFAASTVQRNRLLRQFPHINNLTFANQPLGESKVRAFSINVNRRFSGGLTANAAFAFTNSRSNRIVEEYDRAPTLWQQDNTSRPVRVTAGAVYELPFGAGKSLLADGGFWSTLASGWQTAGTFEYQPGSLIQFNTNLFFYGNLSDIKKDKPEISLNADGTLNPDKFWFNTANFETSGARTPTSFQTRAFPFQIEGLRGPGLMYANVNIVRTFTLQGRRTLQARMDVQNLFNYAAFSNPVTDPTNTNFGKVVQAVGAAGAMRFFSFTARFTF